MGSSPARGKPHYCTHLRFRAGPNVYPGPEGCRGVLSGVLHLLISDRGSGEGAKFIPTRCKVRRSSPRTYAKTGSGESEALFDRPPRYLLAKTPKIPAVLKLAEIFVHPLIIHIKWRPLRFWERAAILIGQFERIYHR